MALVPALSPRLAVIADWLPRGCVFADIGTDHALLPTAVTARDPTARAIAVDRRAGPLTAARETVARWGLATRVDLRLAEGLSAIAPGEVDTVTIAGMGGERIIEIFASAPEVSAALTRVILQPNTDAPRVRRWLTQAGWTLVDERAPTVRGACTSPCTRGRPRSSPPRRPRSARRVGGRRTRGCSGRTCCAAAATSWRRSCGSSHPLPPRRGAGARVAPDERSLSAPLGSRRGCRR
ncbi:MAG: SAM-dependent methyltransferase [Myxococcales bacterium]|nr:SAM-dependent methyltransferase [Myxococcales bacterium]